MLIIVIEVAEVIPAVFWRESMAAWRRNPAAPPGCPLKDCGHDGMPAYDYEYDYEHEQEKNGLREENRHVSIGRTV